MNPIPEYLIMRFGIDIQLSPINICAIVALGLCVAIVWRVCRRRI